MSTSRGHATSRGTSRGQATSRDSLHRTARLPPLVPPQRGGSSLVSRQVKARTPNQQVTRSSADAHTGQSRSPNMVPRLGMVSY